MFGIRNISPTFIFETRFGKFVAEFVAEVTLNVTGVAVANAAEIPEGGGLVSNYSKEQLVKSTAIAAASGITSRKVFALIANATPNMLV